MELVAIIATVILLATILTMIFSFAAYFVTRAKSVMKSRAAQRQPDSAPEAPAHGSGTKIYFERYHPDGGKAEDETRSPASPHGDQWT